jgi:hypothetical protein
MAYPLRLRNRPTSSILCVISGFQREVERNCALLGYYIASSGNSLPTFRGNLSVPFSRVNTGPETSVSNYYYSLHYKLRTALFKSSLLPAGPTSVHSLRTIEKKYLKISKSQTESDVSVH